MYLDDVDPGPGSVRNKADRKRMLKRSTATRRKPRKDAGGSPGSSWTASTPSEGARGYDPAQVEQWFLNRKDCTGGRGVRPRAQISKQSRGPDDAPVIEPGSTIVIGVDGARYQDAIAAVACDVKTDHIWELAIIRRRAPAVGCRVRARLCVRGRRGPAGVRDFTTSGARAAIRT